MLYTGLRRSELYRLKWKDIDWENECLLVEKSKNVCNILDDNKK
ncbi:tyrosine-type recombinase/integrase [Massiliimalia timonensis]